MAFIGNTSTTQSFTPAIDYFSGNGVTTAFTLSRPVASVAQVQVVVENVPQVPGTAFSVSGNTITFDGAPPSGTNNIYVYYVTINSQIFAPSDGSVGTAQIANNSVTVAKISATGTPTAGTYLQGNGSWAAITSLPGYQGQVFTSSGTFTVPAGITAVKVTVIGAGGRGRNATTNGSAGGTSSFGAFCSATGGAGGSNVVAAGGTATGGDINISGGRGGAGGTTNDGAFPTPTWYHSAGGGGAAGGGDGAYGVAAFLGGPVLLTDGIGGGGAWGRGGTNLGAVEAVGFGSGGRGIASTSTGNVGGASGGGGGGVAIRWITGLTPGQAITVTVGTQGATGTTATNGAVIVEW